MRKAPGGSLQCIVAGVWNVPDAGFPRAINILLPSALRGRGWQDREGVRKRGQRQFQLPLRGRSREEPDKGTGREKGHVPKAAHP